jgi:hypothetical protein
MQAETLVERFEMEFVKKRGVNGRANPTILGVGMNSKTVKKTINIVTCYVVSL